LWAGNLQTAIKGGNWVGFVSSLVSFALSLAREACQCAYKSGKLSLEYSVILSQAIKILEWYLTVKLVIFMPVLNILLMIHALM